MKSNFYSIYRASNIDQDNVIKDNEPCSLSFGHSLFGGIAYDAQTGSAIGFATDTRDVFAVNLKKKNYHANHIDRYVLFIPPARGITKLVEEGEIDHVRSRVFCDQKTIKNRIHGFGNISFMGKLPYEFDFLQTTFDLYKTASNYQQIASAYLATHSVLLISAQQT